MGGPSIIKGRAGAMDLTIQIARRIRQHIAIKIIEITRKDRVIPRSLRKPEIINVAIAATTTIQKKQTKRFLIFLKKVRFFISSPP